MSADRARGDGFKMYQQVYFAVIAALALAMLVTYGFLHTLLANPADRKTPAFTTMSQLLGATLPAAGAPQPTQAAAMQDLIDRIGADMALYSADGRLIYGGGSRTLAPPPPGQRLSGWVANDHETYAALLPDRRWLLVTFERGEMLRRASIGAALFLIFLMVGAGIYPVVRKITGRLERLQRQVSALGDGDLSARADIGGEDEVGVLARSFNRSAAQLEAIVMAQKSLLANASHELRSPLARIEMALSLLGTPGADIAAEEIHQSVGELDAMIGEILLASRLESGKSMPDLQLSTFDLPRFLHEQCAPYGAAVDSETVHLVADRPLLKRVLRNLLENAARHGGGTAVDVAGRAAADGMVEISVGDRGPGVGPDARDRIFEPFFRLSGAGDGVGGVGLGLAIVRSIATLHGGTVDCRARPGGGALFVVRVPHHGGPGAGGAA